ncbi:MAG: hypothetical protein KME32_01385 [Mojavia pulchra JT2-VF2]|jgi:hypothetical protein|uniref:Uncharacterized protein n=1 Tax=Mojavia pulchra JT2-VF2 TaxID=287848 RepID=A0A951UE40_9NOST|nr:hypothetical protein [Mojavia pulchra JT2-VF2]
MHPELLIVRSYKLGDRASCIIKLSPLLQSLMAIASQCQLTLVIHN